MPLKTHGEEKFKKGGLLSGPAEWEALRLEHRRVEPGPQGCVTPECNEYVYILSGVTTVKRTGDGQTQEAVARPGTSWLVPAGTHETFLRTDGNVELLVAYLPSTLLEHSALADYDIDPDRAQLAYAGGFSDPVLSQIGLSLRTLVGRETPQPTDRLFADGLRMALAAHLLGNYGVDRWPRSARAPSLDIKRLRRVIEMIEARLADDISLADLAAEACLSPFHFSRLFQEATGLSPHRYVMERRIQAAQKMLLSTESTLADIAIDTGFGSQANFTRAFRKFTGATPGRFRELPMR